MESDLTIHCEVREKHERSIGMGKRNFKNTVKLLILSGAVLILSGTDQLTAARANPVSDIKENSMKPVNTLEAESAAIPLIDAGVPAVFETASFGLG